MKPIPMDGTLEQLLEKLDKDDAERRAVVDPAKQQVKDWIKRHTPIGGWPVKTVEDVNTSVATEAAERHNAKWEEVFKPGIAARIRSGARIQGLGTPKESK